MIRAGQVWTGVVYIAFTLSVMTCVALLLLLAVRHSHREHRVHRD
jgi:hypothetical protein